jgi:hypothetical protein
MVKKMVRGWLGVLFLVLPLLGPAAVFAQSGNDQPPAEEVTPDPWPKITKDGGATYTIYQPQLDSGTATICRSHCRIGAGGRGQGVDPACSTSPPGHVDRGPAPCTLPH